MARKFRRLWSWVSHFDTLVELFTTLSILGALIGGVVGAVVTWLGSYGLAGGFLLVVVGLVGGIWIVNGLRWRKGRPPESVGLDASTPLLPQNLTADLPRWIRSEVAYAHFGCLWKDDPYIVFGLAGC